MNLNDIDDVSQILGSSTFDVNSVAIGGKLVSVHSTLHRHEVSQMSDFQERAELKRRLTEKLVEFILNNNLVECTFQKHLTEDALTVHARLYLAPNELIKLIRLHGNV